jgi:hypothetical protein
MFSFFKKAKKVAEETQPQAIQYVDTVRNVFGMPECPSGIYLSNDERRIAVKYGLTYEQFAEMRKELRSARTIGRPAGSKNKKRSTRKKKIQP